MTSNASPAESPTLLAPPPWKLTGEGIIVLASAAAGQRGLLMFVRYAGSGVGPYDEVLWIPLLRISPPQTILAIRVSTGASVDSGRRYWGLPKQLAHFDWLAPSPESRFIRVRNPADDDLSISFEGRAVGPVLPVNTTWLPSSLLRLEQILAGRRFRFTPAAHGSLQLMKEVRVECRGAEFPVIEKVIAAVRVPHFEMSFPAAAISEL